MMRYYGDIEVGARYETGDYTITEEEMISFAEQFDPQPFHIDEGAAERSIFGGLIASGMHTLAVTMRLYVTEFVQGPDGVANIGGFGMDELRLPEPVRPDDTLHAEIEVVDKESSETRGDRGYVDFKFHTRTESTEVLSVISHSIIARDE